MSLQTRVILVRNFCFSLFMYSLIVVEHSFVKSFSFFVKYCPFNSIYSVVKCLLCVLKEYFVVHAVRAQRVFWSACSNITH